MFKAFSLLWLVVFVPIFFLIMPHGYSPLPAVNESALKSFYVTSFSGTFYLLEKRLKATPEPEWPGTIEQLSTEFGYELKLVPLHSATEQASLQKQLQANEFAFSNGNPELLMHRILDSNWVISMSLDVNTSETIGRTSQGTIYLMKQEFENVPAEQWPEILDKLTDNFQFDLKIQSIEELNLEAEELNLLQLEKLIWITQSDGRLVFYHKLPGQDSVLVAGKIDVRTNASLIYLIFGIIFVLLVSIGMFMWVYPLWRDLNRLGDTATQFGGGHLEQRAELSKNSVIARLSQSFNIMADRLEKLILGHKELTNAIAHDLRTPLYRLRFAFDMLDSDDITAEEQQKYKRSINTSIEDLDQLISQTLILSRYSRALDISHLSECQLATNINSEIDQFALEHQSLQIKFLAEEQLKDQLFFVDSRALIRALNNLLTNASRYAKAAIKISLSIENENYLLIVEDDGPGIDSQHWEKIFQPFVQLENIQRDSACGHGLGLAIVEQIALWHKGSVQIENSDLGGAKFKLRWPIKLN